MNDQHTWPRVGDHVTLHTPQGPQALVITCITGSDPQGIPYAHATDPSGTRTWFRRIDILVKGWA